MERLSLEMAEKAFVKCQDYHGIKFVKRLAKLDVSLVYLAFTNKSLTLGAHDLI